MPTGSFPELAEDISLEHLISLSAAYFVSIESALLRAVRLTAKPAGMFAAARLDGRRLRLDYLSGSRAWKPSIGARTITSAEALTRCTAVGFTAKDVVDSDEGALSLECVGAPPYPHTRYPRIVGLIRPTDGLERECSRPRFVALTLAQQRKLPGLEHGKITRESRHKTASFQSSLGAYWVSCRAHRGDVICALFWEAVTLVDDRVARVAGHHAGALQACQQEFCSWCPAFNERNDDVPAQTVEGGLACTAGKIVPSRPRAVATQKFIWSK